MSTVDDLWKQLEEEAKKSILSDKDLHTFLSRYIPDVDDRNRFIKACLRKKKTRRMLLRLQWFSQIADDLTKVKEARPALQFIFLMALAEGIVGERTGDYNMPSRKAVGDFFKYTTPDDKIILQNGIRRSLASSSLHSLRFSSIISILYEARNRAVHGKDFWVFTLPDSNDMQNSLTMLTEGWLGKPGRKRRLPLEINLTYEDIRDVFSRTALENIRAVL